MGASLFILLLPSVGIVLFAAIVYAMQKRNARLLREDREHSIFLYFVDAAKRQKVRILELGVELQWVAMIRLGYPGDKKMLLLEPAARSRVQSEIEDLARVGQDLMRRGLLRPFLTEFNIHGKKHSMKPPETLVCLTRQGEALVNQMMSEGIS